MSAPKHQMTPEEAQEIIRQAEVTRKKQRDHIREQRRKEKQARALLGLPPVRLGRPTESFVLIPLSEGREAVRGTGMKFLRQYFKEAAPSILESLKFKRKENFEDPSKWFEDVDAHLPEQGWRVTFDMVQQPPTENEN